MKRYVLYIIILFCIVNSARAQSAHYWNQNYGLRGELLNGALISGSEDNSSIYYNPASVTNMKEKTRFSLSGFAGTYTLFKHTNGAGENTDLSFGKFEVVPKVIAGSFRPFKKKEGLIGYFGVFRRNNYNFEVQNQLEQTKEIIQSISGEEFLQGNFEYADRLRETWVTVGFAYKFENNISVGGGLTMAFMNRNYLYSWSKNIFENAENKRIVAFVDEELSFTHSMKFNMLNKFGMSWDKNGYKIGLTLTTPTLFSAIDKATLNYNLNQQLPGDTGVFVFNDINKKLKAKYKLPFSVGIGTEIPIGNVRVSLSTEYFHKQKEYNLLFPQNKDEIQDHFYVKNYTDWVVNGALGIHINLKRENVDLLGGFRSNLTNKRSTASDNIFELHTFNVSQYHVSFGSVFNVKRNVFSIGLDYGFSPQKKDKGFIDLGYVDFDDFRTLQSAIESDVKLHTITFVLGYEIFKE